jgi:hypothetical protein
MSCLGCGSLTLSLDRRSLCRFCRELYAATLRRRVKLAETLRMKFAWRRK